MVTICHLKLAGESFNSVCGQVDRRQQSVGKTWAVCLSNNNNKLGNLLSDSFLNQSSAYDLISRHAVAVMLSGQ